MACTRNGSFADPVVRAADVHRQENRSRPELTLVLCEPRGFCAGVVRAIEIVERAIAIHGPPVYVRHEIVHNRHVVETLRQKGAVFVDSLDEIPDTSAPVIFSAHGVPKRIPERSAERGFRVIDATCPLVTKVHREAERHFAAGRRIILIGHAGHPEVKGTLGQLPPGAMHLVSGIEDVKALNWPRNTKVACLTQTTLGVDDTAAIIEFIQSTFTDVFLPAKRDICYATTNRQAAVKKAAVDVEAMLIVGSQTSSNSLRLVEVAQNAGCKKAWLIESAADIVWSALRGMRRIGLSAGASAPEILIQDVVEACRQRFHLTLEPIVTTREAVVFSLPAAVRGDRTKGNAARPPGSHAGSS